jgi:Tol biopolymer transport system component
MMPTARSYLPLIAVLLVGACTKPDEAKEPVGDPPPAPEAVKPAAEQKGPPAAAHGRGGPHVKTPLAREDEPHLQNTKQLTFGGENAEAYFNKDGTQLSFQAKRGEMGCDQIFRMGVDGKGERQVSVGKGRTTCAYIQTDDSIVYASTHGHGEGCLADPDRSQGYVWPLYPEFDIWAADADGANARVLFASPGYDAEATICHRDGRVIFTSTKAGDLDLYVMDKDGKNVRQLTDTPGYDGGAFFSSDCSKIVWRASRPEGDALADYQRLLAKNLVRPSKLEIFVADIDDKGAVTNTVQVTNNGKANFAPYLHPDNKRLLFVSNKGDPKGRDFDIYLINVDGTGEERVTTNPTFDGFPMFSHDGSKLVFASNRNNEKRGDTNVFLADWVD